ERIEQGCPCRCSANGRHIFIPPIVIQLQTNPLDNSIYNATQSRDRDSRFSLGERSTRLEIEAEQIARLAAQRQSFVPDRNSIIRIRQPVEPRQIKTVDHPNPLRILSIFRQGNTNYAAGRNYLCSRTDKAAYGLLHGRQDTFSDHLIAYDF